MLNEYRTHASQLLETTRRYVAQATGRWYLALAFAALITLALGMLTFSALSFRLPLVTAALTAAVLHLIAVVSVHAYYFHRDRRWRWPALVAWIGLSAVAFTIALHRGLTWFEGSLAAALALAAMEPLGIWVAGLATAMAHLNLARYRDYHRRSHDVFDACARNPRPERAWGTKLQHVRDEYVALEQPPAHFESHADEAHRQEQAAHVLEYLRLMEGHATADGVREDLGEVPALPARAEVGPAPGEAAPAPREVPLQPDVQALLEAAAPAPDPVLVGAPEDDGGNGRAQ